jgi:ankyrin repeat protein
MDPQLQPQEALERKDFEGLRSLLGQESVDINGGDTTILHHACGLGQVELVRVLLRHPRILVNKRDDTGSTPFLVACWGGMTEVVKELLKDSRVDINLPDEEKATPLWYAACLGFQEVIFWMVASGRTLDFDKRASDGTTPVEIARKSEKTRVADFLKMFRSNPRQAQVEIQFRLGIEGL